jgi:hypothetical protein
VAGPGCRCSKTSDGFTTKAAGTVPLGKTAEAHALVESRQSARAIIQIGRQP